MSSNLKENTKFHSATHRDGFTLIEMMVAVSIFLIVAFVVTATFLVALDAYRKAQQIRLVIDNVNYAMDRIAVNAREGTNYYLSGDKFSFNSFDGKLTEYFLDRGADGRAGTVREFVNNCGDASGCVKSLTDSKIKINGLKFEIYEPGATSRPPMVKINMYGVVTLRSIATEINVQTTVTQRNTR